MTIDKDILLDMLFLLVNVNTNKTRSIVNEILEYHQSKEGEYVGSQFSNISGDTKIFENIVISIIDEVIGSKLVREKNDKELSLLFSKMKTHDLFLAHPEWLDYLRDVLIGEIYQGSDKSEESTYLERVSQRINNIVLWIRCNKNVRKIYGHLNNINVKDDPNKVQNAYEKLTTISDVLSKELRNSKDLNDLAIEKINLSNINDIRKAYELYKERNITGVIKSGLQGLNDMCGSKGGFALGKSILFCALTHNYKSTMLLSIARWIREHNTFENKNGKKPLVLFISLENEAHENMILWFKHLKYNVFENNPIYKDIDIDNLNLDDKLTIINQYFNASGIEFEILRYLPNDFGFDELVELIHSYEDNGYYIVSCIIDYLRKMKLTTNEDNGKYSQKGNYLLIMELFNKVCNFLRSKGITLFTAHQLNRNASSLVNSGVPYPVKRFNESYLEGSIDVAREVDMIIYMHIEKNHKEEPFLTLQWGKHRYEDETPEKNKFVAYKFEENGIIDDFGSKYRGIKDIYSSGGNSLDVKMNVTY